MQGLLEEAEDRLQLAKTEARTLQMQQCLSRRDFLLWMQMADSRFSLCRVYLCLTACPHRRSTAGGGAAGETGAAGRGRAGGRGAVRGGAEGGEGGAGGAAGGGGGAAEGAGGGGAGVGWWWW